MAWRIFTGGLGLVVLASVGGVAALRAPAIREHSQRPPTDEPPRFERGASVIHPELGFLGVTIAEEAVDLGSRFGGRVAQVLVQVGTKVREGSIVARLDSRAANQELAVAEAVLRSSRAEAEVARLSLEEAQERLTRRDEPRQLSTGAISEEELSAARYSQRLSQARLEKAQAQIAEQEAHVAQLRLQVEEATLRAPFDGVVAARFVHPGAMVEAGRPLIHLLRSGVPQVRFAVPSARARSITVGSLVRMEAPELGLVSRGRISQVAPEIDVASRMVFVVAELERDTTSPPLPSGTVMRVTLQEEQARSPGGARE